MELRGYYHDKLYETLVANGYEKQLKESIILKKVFRFIIRLNDIIA